MAVGHGYGCKRRLDTGNKAAAPPGAESAPQPVIDKHTTGAEQIPGGFEAGTTVRLIEE